MKVPTRRPGRDGADVEPVVSAPVVLVHRDRAVAVNGGHVCHVTNPPGAAVPVPPLRDIADPWPSVNLRAPPTIGVAEVVRGPPVAETVVADRPRGERDAFAAVVPVPVVVRGAVRIPVRVQARPAR